MSRIRVVPFFPPGNDNKPPKKNLAALREKLICERLANLNNPDYLHQRAAEYRRSGDKAAWIAYTLQAESVARY